MNHIHAHHIRSFLALVMTLSFVIGAGHAFAAPGAHSATVSGNVFLGGNYIELGLSPWGSFGSTVAKPAGFYGTAVRSGVGMSADFDGFGDGQDLRIDYFMPGAPEERWVAGYKIGATMYTGSNAAIMNVTDIPNSVVNTSSGDVLSAVSTGTLNSNLEIIQNISFGKDEKYFRNTVTLKNVSASDTLSSVRYMRSFDPDNTVDKSGSYATRNTIKSTYAVDGYACVEAKTYSDTDPIFTATGSRAPILLCSTDSRAIASTFGFSNGNPYDALAYDSAPARGYTVDDDQAITLAFDVGTLAPGQSTSFVYFTSLDDRDFSQVIREIVVAPITVNYLTTIDTTPALSGSVDDPAATVTVTVGGNTYTAINNGNGTWTLPDNTISVPLALGTYSVTAVATNGGLTNTDPTTNELLITSSVTTPPTVGVYSRMTSDTTPALFGSVDDPDVPVQVTVNGTTYNATNNHDGSWTLADNTIAPLPDGVYEVAASATNAYGTGSDNSTNEMTIDTIAPETILTSLPPVSPSSSDSASFHFTGDDGTGTGIDSFECRLDTASFATCTSPASLSGLADGPHTFQIRARDKVSNIDSTPVSVTWTVDGTAPAAPSISTPASGAALNSRQPTFSGTAEAGSTVIVKDVGGNTICSAVATGGNWSCAPDSDLTEGDQTINVTASDTAGNTSPVSSQTFSIDVTAPSAPTISNPTANAQTNDTTPTFSGTAEASSTVTVTEGTTTLCTATADGSGDWSCTPTTALSDGSHTVNITATDAAGNTSAPASRSFTVDVTAPAEPTVESPSDGIQTNDTTPTFSGKAEANTIVTVTEGATTLCTATADGSGVWSCTPATALNQGAHTVNITATDAAGNTSAPTSRSFTVDTAAPGAPVVTNPTANAQTNDTTPTFSGTTEANSTVTVTEGATTLCTATADGSGVWSCTPATALSEGAHTVTITASDAAGNTSEATSRSFTVDLTDPAEPTVGSPSDGAALNSPRPTFSGAAAVSEAGGTVTVKEGTTTICTATVAANGDWSCQPDSDLSDGAHNVAITLSDRAGNTSSSVSVSFTVDTDAPAAPAVAAPLDDGLVGDTRPTFSGTVPAGEVGGTVTVKEGATTICTATVEPGGIWSCQAANVMSDGLHTVSMVISDVAGNDSPPVSRSFRIDSTLPDTPVIDSDANTSDTKPQLSGTAETDATVSVTFDLDGDGAADVTYSGITVGGDGAWNLDTGTATPTSGTFPAGGLAQGTYTVHVIAQDALGRSSAPAVQTLVVDTTAPTAPVVTSPESTSDTTPVFTGTGEAGAQVILALDLDGNGVADVTFQTYVDGDGNWSINTSVDEPEDGTFPVDGLAEGSYTYTLTLTDPAGNRSDEVQGTRQVDTTAPVAPVITTPAPEAPVSGAPKLAGTAEPGSTVQVTIDKDGDPATTDDIVVFTTTADAEGNWSVDTATATPDSGTWGSGLSEDDTPTFSLQVIDAAGNVSSTETHTPPSVDTTPPAQPQPLPESANSATPTFSGKAEPGSQVVVKVNGVVVCETTADSNGDWSCTSTTALAEGEHDVSVTVSDVAGNSATTSSKLTVDTGAPGEPTLALAGVVSSRKPLLRGTAEPGSTVVVEIDPDNDPATDNTVVYSTTADANGNWGIDLGTTQPTSGALADGGLAHGAKVSVKVTITDAVGNSTTIKRIITIAYACYMPVVGR